MGSAANAVGSTANAVGSTAYVMGSTANAVGSTAYVMGTHCGWQRDEGWEGRIDNGRQRSDNDV